MSEAPQQKTPLQKTAQFALLAFFIVVAPLISWYYLSAGYDYQKTSMKELRKYGTYADFNFKTNKGHILTADSFSTRVVLTGILTENDQQNDLIIEKMALLHGQFDDRNDILFAAINASGKDQGARIEKYGFKDYPQCMVLESDKAWPATAFKLPTGKVLVDGADSLQTSKMNSGVPNDYSFLILTDAKQQIRNYYNLQKGEEIKRLVEQMALLMPRTEPNELSFNEK